MLTTNALKLDGKSTANFQQTVPLQLKALMQTKQFQHFKCSLPGNVEEHGQAIQITWGHVGEDENFRQIYVPSIFTLATYIHLCQIVSAPSL